MQAAVLDHRNEEDAAFPKGRSEAWIAVASAGRGRPHGNINARAGNHDRLRVSNGCGTAWSLPLASFRKSDHIGKGLIGFARNQPKIHAHGRARATSLKVVGRHRNAILRQIKTMLDTSMGFQTGR